MFFSRLLSLDYSRFVCFPHSSSIDVLILAFLPKEMSKSSTSKNVIFYPTIALTGRSYCLLLICLTADRSNIFFFFLVRTIFVVPEGHLLSHAYKYPSLFPTLRIRKSNHFLHLFSKITIFLLFTAYTFYQNIADLTDSFFVCCFVHNNLEIPVPLLSK